LAGVICVRGENLLPPGSRPTIGQSAGAFADADPRWSGLPEAMNGVINSRQTTLLADTFLGPVPSQFLFAGTIVFAKVCFLITVVSWRSCR